MAVEGKSEIAEEFIGIVERCGQLLPFLESGSKKTIVNYTSGLASVGLDFGAKTATYSMSKMAVNMLVRLHPRCTL